MTQTSIPSVTGYLTAIGKGKAQTTATDKKPEDNSEKELFQNRTQ
jgi:hypothetical protein